MTVGLYLHSLRHLKPGQIYWRGYRRLRGSAGLPTRLAAPAVLRAPRLVLPVSKHRSWQGRAFRFLNRTVTFDAAIPWNRPDLEKLWLYNLHYFDWINQPSADLDAATALMQEWVRSNPPGEGNGWEPYPTSLRLVNWIKFFDRCLTQGRSLDQELVDSLYLQARHLGRRLERHLLGNHLFKNAVALLFAGRCLGGSEPLRWYGRARDILLAQLREQLLPDGGHFERSAMYHAITLEDVLDCLNLLRAADPGDPPLQARLASAAEAMGGFLADVLHPDGEIPLFNDAAIGIAAPPQALFEYAGRLGLTPPQVRAEALVAKPDYGLYVMRQGHARLLFDAGAIGPDYLPGHAHCDTLSFELSLDQARWIVNAGTYSYTGPERARFRGTAAHNTVMIDGAEQHEIWSSFRVARRGYPVRVRAREGLLEAGHTGYRRLPGAPLHLRRIKATADGFRVRDRIEGQGSHRAASRLHLHPDVVVQGPFGGECVCRAAGRTLRIASIGAPLRLEPYDYSPQFGVKRSGQCLVAEAAGPAPLELELHLILQ